MTPQEYWDKLNEFEWGLLHSLDYDEVLDASCGLTNLRVIAVQHGPEYEHLFNQFKLAHTYGHIGRALPPRPGVDP